MPAKILVVWLFIDARYAPLAPIVSIDITNTSPALLCKREPLRTTIAAEPERRPMIPPQMWTIRSGEYVILLFLSCCYGTDWKNSQISFAAWMSRFELPSKRQPCVAGCGTPCPPPLMV